MGVRLKEAWVVSNVCCRDMFCRNVTRRRPHCIQPETSLAGPVYGWGKGGGLHAWVLDTCSRSGLALLLLFGSAGRSQGLGRGVMRPCVGELVGSGGVSAMSVRTLAGVSPRLSISSTSINCAGWGGSGPAGGGASLTGACAVGAVLLLLLSE